jgi:DNA polymerase (family X)
LSKNAEVAALLDHIADLLELKQERFKPVAYRRAAEQVRVSTFSVDELAKEGRLHEIPGVGASIAAKIQEYLETGRLKYLQKLEKEVPGGLSGMVDLPGLGPKRVASLHKELGVRGVEDLKEAAKKGKIAQLEGFGEKTQQAILHAVAWSKKSPSSRFLQQRGFEAAKRFMHLIEGTGKTERVAYAGSLRRGRDSIGDVDIVASARKGDEDAVMEAFCSAAEIEKVIAHGSKKSSIRLADGLQVDLRVVEPEQFGAALLYFTGSKAHNVALRKRAMGYGWTLNEYGLTRKKDDKLLAGATEEEVYSKLKVGFIPPELREDHGEIEAAKKDKLPRLVELKDVVSDLHTHTRYSDGRDTPKKMLQAAHKRGLKVYGFSDHSYSLRTPKGETGRLRKQAKELDRLRKDHPDVLVLQGSEVNIKKDGSLDTSKSILKELDYVIGSIHNAFDLSPKEQTKRILKAIDAGIDIFGHPLSRRMPKRPPIRFHEEKVFEACAENGVLLEVDGQPERLDLPGEMIMKAKQAGCRFTLDSDAHSTKGLAHMEAAVVQARRGWLEKQDIVSTWTPKRIEKSLGRIGGH